MSRGSRASLTLYVILSFAAVAHGQAFNIDCGGVFGVPPSDAYGAGAGQSGYWNPTTNIANGMRDIHGTATDASFASGGGVTLFDIAGATGDDERLMESLIQVQATDPTGIFGLRAGLYDVYVYSWLPRDEGTRTVHIAAFNGDGTTNVVAEITYGGPWPGQQVEGETFARLTIDVIDGRNFIGLGISGGFGKELTNALNGIQIVPIPAPGSAALCFSLGAIALRRKR